MQGENYKRFVFQIRGHALSSAGGKNETKNANENGFGGSEKERSDAPGKEEYLKYVDNVASIEDKERILDEARKCRGDFLIKLARK